MDMVTVRKGRVPIGRSKEKGIPDQGGENSMCTGIRVQKVMIHSEESKGFREHSGKKCWN